MASNRLSPTLRSRPLRVAFGVLFALAILSPAAVVFAVVWTAPSVTQPPAVPVNTEPARLLPAPDVQPAQPSGCAGQRLREHHVGRRPVPAL